MIKGLGMIPMEEFDIRIGQSCSCAYVRVEHRESGNVRSADCLHGESVDDVRDRLVAELTGIAESDESGA